MSLSAIINNALAAAASDMTTRVLHEAITRLADKYGFDFAEAIQFINLEPARPEVLKKKDLPWCGVVDAEWCLGITGRGGLWTQCPKPRGEGGYCVTCAKQKAEAGVLKCGEVADRLAAPFEYGDRKVTPFSKFMEKNGWSKELVERSAAEYGLTIPPENFVVPKPKRGRKVTRPTMSTPEPEAPVIVEPATEPAPEPEVVVHPPVDFSSQEEEEAAMPTPTPVSGFTTYSATEPDSDEELEAEHVPAERVTRVNNSGPAAETPKKKGRPASPKTEGDVAPKKKGRPASPKVEGETPKKKGRPASPKEPTETGTSPAVAAPPQEPKKKVAADYSAITATEAATMKPMALRTACAQHGIEIGSKPAETLRAELIAKVTA